MKRFSAQPIIVIGAGRSGTNMLRDVLTGLQGVDTWPCDEINYIWRHGNRDFHTDEFTRDMATQQTVSFIRGEFKRMSKKLHFNSKSDQNNYIVEKTCANSLRVPFVNAVVPEAKYIFLVRDGRDVIASAKKRWQAGLDIPYLFAKAKYVPRQDLPYYASSYFVNRFSKLFNKNNAIKVWGPRFSGMNELASTGDLDKLCATQWVKCVEASKSAFSEINEANHVFVKYEDFVKKPQLVLESIANKFQMSFLSDDLVNAVSIVRQNSIGNGKSEELSDDVLSLLAPTLADFGYID